MATLYTGNVTVGTQGGQSNAYVFDAEVIETVDSANNRSHVYCNLYAKGINGWSYAVHQLPISYINIDGVRKATNQVSAISSSRTLICSWDGYITHNDDGKKTIRVTFNFSPEGDNTYYIPTNAKITAEAVALTDIPRYATINSFTVSKRDETSLKLDFTTNATCDYAWYRYKLSTASSYGSWTGVDIADGTSGSFNVTGLSANSTYDVQLRVRRKDSQLTTDSDAVPQSTYDYPKVLSIGSNPLVITNQQTLNLYNPLGRNITVKMYQNNTSGTQLYSGTTSVKGDNVQYKFTPLANTLYTSIPNSPDGNCVYSVVYGNVTKTTGTAKYQIIGTETPTFNAANWTYIADKTGLTNNNQIVINNQSTISYSVNTPAISNYGATISKYKLKWGNKSTDITGNTGNVAKGDGNTLTVIAYDSRGLYTETIKQLGNNFINYSDIDIETIDAPRNNGVEAGVKLNLSGKLFNGQFGSNGVNNALYSAKYYVSADGNNWSTGYTIPISNFSVFNEKFTLSNYAIHANGSSGGFTIGQEYYVKVEIKDGQGQLSTDEIIGKIADGKFAVDLYKDSNGDYHLGLNGLANSNYAGDIHGSVNVDAIYIGGIKAIWKE